MISALGGINGMTFAGMRLYSTFGRDERLFARLSGRRGGTPLGSIVAMMVFAVGMMTLFETGEYWKPWLAQRLDALGSRAVHADSHDLVTAGGQGEGLAHRLSSAGCLGVRTGETEPGGQVGDPIQRLEQEKKRLSTKLKE